MEEIKKCEKCNGSGIVYEANGSSHTCFDCLKAGNLTSFHYKEEQVANNDSACPKCHSTGIIKEKDGTNHTCWDCLTSGRLDNHSKVQDSGIKI